MCKRRADDSYVSEAHAPAPGGRRFEDFVQKRAQQEGSCSLASLGLPPPPRRSFSSFS